MVDVFEALRAMEPIFHTRAFGTDYAGRMAEDYWEIGASGARYGREELLRLLASRDYVDAEEAGWECRECALRQLGACSWLFTYLLRQGERVTRRATVWERRAEGGVISYHQGTVLAG